MDARITAPNRSGRDATRLAAAIISLVSLTVAGAFAFEFAGYAPCELCLKERLPYYLGLAVAAVTLLLTSRGAMRPARVGFALLALLFLFSAGFGVFHAGVEWGFWPGPSSCTGVAKRATTNADFLQQLQSVHVVRCDAVAIRILGLSLAGWNALISLAIAAIALAGLRRSA